MHGAEHQCAIAKVAINEGVNLPRKLVAAESGSYPDPAASDGTCILVTDHSRTRQQNRGDTVVVDPLRNAQEIGEQFNCTERMARELIARRWLPVCHIGRLVRVAQSDLDAYRAACRQPAATGPLAESQAR